MELTEITSDGKPCINKGSTSLLNSNKCPDCGEKMVRALVSHDLIKMYTVVYCPKHPLVVWEDVFDKRDIDTSQDYTNSDKRFDKHY